MPDIDLAHELTDEELEKIERKLRQIYQQASEDIGKKVDEYFKTFKRLDDQKRKQVQSGELSEDDYLRWRKDKILVGEHWRSVQQQIAQRLTQADRDAVDYINGRMPDIYTINYNDFVKDISKTADSIGFGESFELVNREAIRYLALTNETLLPYKYVDGVKAVRWHTQRLNAEIMQGMIQGESISKIAKRLKTNLGMTAKGSAVRNARTAVTSVENQGRMDALHYAMSKGVICKKEWSAIHDSRTRDAHAELDGVVVDVDEPFVNSIGPIMKPGDPNADPANVYNCRCAIIKRVVGFVKL